MKTIASLLVSPLWATTNGLIRAFRFTASSRFPVPVISVGNIMAGGTGKTEVVCHIANRLVSQGKRVTVSMRGYGSAWENKAIVATDFEDSQHLKLPDEALVILKKCPGVAVAIGKKRSEVLRRFWEDIRPDVILLDDGFQHFSIDRDLDILVHNFDVKKPLLRDFPFWFFKSGLRVAFSEVPNFWKKKPWVRMEYYLAGVKSSDGTPLGIPSRANVFCGIGNPQRLRAFLERSGIIVNAMKTYRDHHAYSISDVDFLKKWNQENGTLPLVTTLKDAVKLREFVQSFGGVDGFEPAWIDIGIRTLENEDFFWRKLDECLDVARHSHFN